MTAAAAQDVAPPTAPAAAEALFDQGREAMEREEYDLACARFRESDRLDPAVGTLFNLARCELLRGRVATAWALYRKVVQKLPPRDERLPIAQQAADELEVRLPRLTVRLPPDAPDNAVVQRGELSMSGATLGLALPVDPGEYTLVVTAPGHAPAEQTITIAEAEQKSILLQLGAPLPVEPVPAPAASPGASAASPADGAANPSVGAPTPGPQQDVPSDGLPRRAFNVSVFHPLGFPDSDQHLVNIELGIFYGHLGGLNGAAVTFGMSRVGELRGIMLSGIASYVEGPSRGVAVSGLLTVSEGPVDGLSAAGLGNLQIGRKNYGRQRLFAAQVAGLANIVVGDFNGLDVAGLGNVVIGKQQGLQVAGLGNVHTKDGSGVRLSGLGNVTFGSFRGLAVAGLTNVADELIGGQAGLVNVAGNMKGFQFGLINVADEVEGISLGVVSYSHQKGAQPLFWGSTAYPLNLGVRFEHGFLVTTPSVSFAPDDKLFEAVPGLTFGVPIRLGDFFIEPDVGYRVEIKKDELDVERHRFPIRLGVGWQPHEYIRLHAGGGVVENLRKLDGALESERVDPLAFFGISTLH